MVTVENRVRSSVTPFLLEDFANLVFGFCYLFLFEMSGLKLSEEIIVLISKM